MSRKTTERGLFYLLFLGVVLVLIMIIALGLEIGRLLVADRQLQNAADAASLAAVQLLYRCDTVPNNTDSTSPATVPLNGETGQTVCSGCPACPAGSRGGWQASKAAVIGVLKNYKILGREITNPVYNSGITTYCDEKGTETNPLPAGYGTTFQSTQGSYAPGFQFTVIRMFECQKNDGTKDILPIDGGTVYSPGDPVVELSTCGTGYPYCVANAVRVDLEMNIYMPLARVFRIVDPSRTIRATATSVLRLNDPDDPLSPITCTYPSCTLLKCNTCPNGDPTFGTWPDCPPNT